jgi:hypothetical protein
VKTEDLIVRLARGARPVRSLRPPWARFARWTAVAVLVETIGALAIGVRSDVAIALQQPAFAGLAAATLLTALLSGAAVFALSVPGIERSPLQRTAPLASGALWVGWLVVLLMAGGQSMRRLAALPIHAACVIEIVGFGVLVGWPLFAMLRRAAPLRPTWSALLAALAAAAFAAAATQLICPIDDPAHHLTGHLPPVVLITILGAAFGRHALDWLEAPRAAIGEP